MEPARDYLLTEERWRTLQSELLSMRERRRAKAKEYALLASTAEHGDMTPDHVRSEILFLDQRIAQLEEALSSAESPARDSSDPGVVGVGSRVQVRWEEGETQTFVIVRPPEARPEMGHISCQSPVGRSLLGRRQGEWVEVPTPDGPHRLEIRNVD